MPGSAGYTRHKSFHHPNLDHQDRRRGVFRPFTWWNLPARAWFLILLEAAVILFLASALASEYFSNVYYQTYVNSLLPILLPTLSIAFAATSSGIAIRLYMTARKARSLQEVETAPRRRTQARRTPRRPAPTPSASPAASVTVPSVLPATTATVQAEAKTPTDPVAVPESKEPSPSTDKTTTTAS